jgi:DNA-binding transcriptional regulator LsrR (DeoR family)
MNERHAMVERMRNDGKTLTEIAEVLGISRVRVNQILTAVSRRNAEETISASDPFSSLNVLVRRRLLRNFPADARPTLSMVREMKTSGALKKVPNIGKLAIQTIENWLQSHGT